MDISTLQALLDSHAPVFEKIRQDDMFQADSAIDYNYALGVEHGFRESVRLIKAVLEAELESRDNNEEAA